ncbi:hypothetical protein [Gottfriedia solisilvae]|uniref:Uncharacterized protein n=1 Tax=Gottfriedia solisilvae TaxID=1516104 RepID=A0A8J3ALF4_9BACI|nr:hypothetical protein [Gottfriedia solisilvae]GGI16588.1 hypothetical protein GCM10007380_33710 [Gottfriedia solisilvae]
MDTKILYFKKYESEVTSDDYVNWAIAMLLNGYSTYSLNILASLSEPRNIFEVEEYFNRAFKELSLREPTLQECVESYLSHLMRRIVDNENNAIDIAYNEVYFMVRDHFINEELSVWYEISEMIDDYRYGDNIGKITKEVIITKIVEEAKKHIN